MRQLILRPPAIFDAFATLASLELLVDVCRDRQDARASRFNVILKQTRPLVNHPSLQQILLKLVGTKEEVEISKEIQKTLKNIPAAQPFTGPLRPRPYPFQQRQSPVCFNCQRRGHIARNCNMRARPQGGRR